MRACGRADDCRLTDLTQPQIKERAWTLTLETVLPSDKGNYTCVAHNTYGRIERLFVLDVVGKIT